MTSERTPVAISRFCALPWADEQAPAATGPSVRRLSSSRVTAEWVLEGEFRNEFERPVAEEGVGVRVHDDREVAACAFLPVGVDETQRRVGAVDPRIQVSMAAYMNSGWPAHRFQGPRRSTCSTTAASKPTPQWKRSALDRSETDAIDVAGIESFEEHRDGVDAVVGEAEDRAKTLVEPPGRVARGVRAGEAVGCFVECAVTADARQRGRSSPGRRIGQDGWRGPVGWSRRG